MNNAKLWLVVKPTIGVPLFLSAVAIGSFSVHVAVLTNTSWVSDFLKGKPLGSGDSAAVSLPQDVQTASYTHTTAQGQEVLIQMADGTYTRAVLKDPAPEAALIASRDGR